jgi:hypothetical protein
LSASLQKRLFKQGNAGVPVEPVKASRGGGGDSFRFPGVVEQPFHLFDNRCCGAWQAKQPVFIIPQKFAVATDVGCDNGTTT